MFSYLNDLNSIKMGQDIIQNKQTLSPQISQLMALHRISDNIFQGESWDMGFRALYGGQVMSQALVAAQLTVDSKQTAHSLHCYFLLPGDVALPVHYQVESLRNGRSFAARSVKALQGDNEIFHGLFSFQTPEDGLSHQTAVMPDVLPPESFEHDMLKFEQNPQLISRAMRDNLHYHKVLDFRTAEIKVEEGVARRSIWMRADEPLENVAQHQAVLCYASDYYFLSSAVKVHGLSPANKQLRLATIDHALWFHRACDFNNWILYVTESPVSDHTRAYVKGQMFQQDGTLIASSTQEGLMRIRNET